MSSSSVKKDILLGAKASVPIVMGFIPVGIAFAVMAENAGLGIAETVFMSVCVFAGASEMMAVEMYKGGAALLAIVLATFIMNLRHVIMSTCIFENVEKLSPLKRLLIGFFVTDESFAVVGTRKTKCSFAFIASLGVIHYLAWVVGTVIGAFAAMLIPKSLSVSLGISLYAMFIALVVPKLRGNLRLFLLVIITAVVNSVLSLFLTGAQSLVVSTLVCAFIGVFLVKDDKAETEEEAEEK